MPYHQITLSQRYRLHELRAIGYVALGKLERPTATAFAARAIRLFQRQPHPVRTVTADNGDGADA